MATRTMEMRYTRSSTTRGLQLALGRAGLRVKLGQGPRSDRGRVGLVLMVLDLRIGLNVGLGPGLGLIAHDALHGIREAWVVQGDPCCVVFVVDPLGVGAQVAYFQGGAQESQQTEAHCPSGEESQECSHSEHLRLGASR